MDQEALHRNEITNEKEGSCTVNDISNLLGGAVKKAMISIKNDELQSDAEQS